MLRWSEPQRFPITLAVHGITRRVGTTSIAANLALKLAQAGHPVLLLDLSLWNCDLTLAFGQQPTAALVQLAQDPYAVGSLTNDSIRGHSLECRPNLYLLPGMENWLSSFALQAENGWNFVQSLIGEGRQCWEYIVADLGCHLHAADHRDTTFLEACAVHAAFLQRSTFALGVIDSLAYPEMWQQSDLTKRDDPGDSILVVNRYSPTLPFGLEVLNLHSEMRKRTWLFPALPNGFLPDQKNTFLVERQTQSRALPRVERTTLRQLEELVKMIQEGKR